MPGDGKKQGLVSIIVPIYNIALYIEECVRSIQLQTHRGIEIILVDDGSTDGSGEICDRLAAGDGRIRVLHQENMGVAAARGQGVAVSAGEYIVFVDGDDWVEPDMLEKALGQMGDAQLLSFGVYRQFSPGRTEKRRDVFAEGRYGEDGLTYILETMIYDTETETLQRFTPWCYNKIYRSSLVKQVYSGLDTSITYAEDSVFLYKYLLRCRSLVICHTCFYHYRYREESAIHAVNDHMLMDINRVYLALAEDFGRHRLGKCLVFQLQKWIALMCCMAVNEHMGFDIQANIPQFIADLSYLEGKRLIVYGAGRMGKDAYVQLRQFGYEVVLWVDKDYRFYRGQGLPVAAPEEMARTEHDRILIAVGREELASQIRAELIEMGCPEACITWKKPIRIY